MKKLILFPAFIMLVVLSINVSYSHSESELEKETEINHPDGSKHVVKSYSDDHHEVDIVDEDGNSETYDISNGNEHSEVVEEYSYPEVDKINEKEVSATQPSTNEGKVSGSK